MHVVEAEQGGIGHRSGHLGIAGERLRGNATNVQTGPSDVLPFDNDNLQTLFRSIFSGAVSTWSSADDDEVSFCH